MVKLIVKIPLDRQQLLDASMHTLTIMEHTNAVLNHIRHMDLQPAYQVLCHPGKDVDVSRYLFGENVK